MYQNPVSAFSSVVQKADPDRNHCLSLIAKKLKGNDRHLHVWRFLFNGASSMDDVSLSVSDNFGITYGAAQVTVREALDNPALRDIQPPERFFEDLMIFEGERWHIIPRPFNNPFFKTAAALMSPGDRAVFNHAWRRAVAKKESPLPRIGDVRALAKHFTKGQVLIPVGDQFHKVEDLISKIQYRLEFGEDVPLPGGNTEIKPEKAAKPEVTAPLQKNFTHVSTRTDIELQKLVEPLLLPGFGVSIKFPDEAYESEIHEFIHSLKSDKRYRPKGFLGLHTIRSPEKDRKSITILAAPANPAAFHPIDFVGWIEKINAKVFKIQIERISDEDLKTLMIERELPLEAKRTDPSCHMEPGPSHYSEDDFDALRDEAGSENPYTFVLDAVRQKRQEGKRVPLSALTFFRK